MSQHKVWNITLNSPWYEYVRDGYKKYEGRCDWKQVKEYVVGDLINVSHHTDSTREQYQIQIVKIHKYKNFEEGLRNLNLNQVLPGVQTVEEGIEIYKKYYKLSTQNEHGICMIEILKI